MDKHDKRSFEDIPPSFTGSYSFSLRYGWLKKAVDYVTSSNARIENSGAAGGRSIRLFDREDSSCVEELGVGTLMIGAMEHWAIGADVIAKQDNSHISHQVTEFGRLIFGKDGFDPFMEHQATSWLVHWNMATNRYLTFIYWLFNCYNPTGAFTKEHLRSEITSFFSVNAKKNAEASVDRDIAASLGCYIAGDKTKKGALEDSLTAHISNLNLIRRIDSFNMVLDDYRDKPSIDEDLLSFFIYQYWSSIYPDEPILNINMLTADRGSPGRVLRINENQMVRLLTRLNSYTGHMQWSETAGVQQLLLKDSNFLHEDNMKNMLKRVYKL